jgi:hexosaminidase
MKMIRLLCLLLAAPALLPAQEVALIPQPAYLKQDKGNYTLPQELTIQVPARHEGIGRIAGLLAAQLQQSTGRQSKINNTFSKADISFALLEQPLPKLGSEGYMLQVSDKGISLKANQEAGLFYGMQTLLQLLPPVVESKSTVPVKQLTVPYVTIVDHPRVGWRGILLDVVRHWFTKEQVKEFIDIMARYKYNLLHLHLSDDQGWRIEIKSLPELTKVGAWRAPRQGRWGEWSKPNPDEPKTYGGFYTQDDIRELVAYARSRFIHILPEIDVPGHSLAMVAAYPELSCTPGTYQVNAGERFMVWEGNGKFYGLLDNNLCPANEKTYEVLDKVFTEVAQLFPFEYIHMGGDECYKGFWEKSDAVKQLMQREGLKNMDEVQSYFVRRVGKIIAAKGKKMIGWDEIMEGGLAEGAAVMSWRGEKGGVEAAQLKHKVVMSPNTYAYVDLYQGDPVSEPPTYGMLRLSQSYQFDPIPAGVDSQYVLGGQANLWSERLSTMRHAQYMLWPRGWALAECLWSPKAVKSWPDFVRRTEAHFVRFDAAKLKYSRSMYDPIFTIIKGANGEPLVQLSTEVDGLQIHYAFDETFPDAFYPVYQQPLSIPKDAVNLKVVTSRNGELVGKIMNMPVAEIKRRMKYAGDSHE